MTAEEIIARLGLERLDPEGGYFRRVYTATGASAATAIYYLVSGDDFSALHRMRTSDELFFHHAGAPLRMLVLDGDGREVVLGSDLAAGQQPQVLIPAGTWQGASPDGAWSLVSTVVVPAFEWSDFELGDQPELTAMFPGWATRIDELSR
ncbi:hypothetical protein SAMN04515671_2098 [Nakamurella panacisegetis]|uniref:DUF985 domain-containing protein n=1 Tax=Nakamurella panacisegetis TaxID=1090615 RepID=A0A1H0MTK6_9ACTN|nr:cupin domain-containing protein [Nakamurella panacisegetis]SDO83753.1 hypothetical protein SAMN04515671_2098 [Nakamurella panacisegetis]